MPPGPLPCRRFFNTLLRGKKAGAFLKPCDCGCASTGWMALPKEKAMRTKVLTTWLACLIGSLMLISGCGAGRTTVMTPAETAATFSAAEIVEDKATVSVPAEVSASFYTKLAQLLYDGGGFTRGPGLKISYRFIQFNPGSQFTRWFWGGIGSAGKGTLTVEARFLDQNDRELARIQSEGEITSGAFGGPFDLAVQKAAQEVANYAKRFR